MKTLWQRLRWKYWDIFRRKQLHEHLDEEVRSHLAIEIQQRIDRGQAPDEARRQAISEIRSVAYVREVTREAWAWAFLESIGQDGRHALRILARTPGQTAVIVLLLAIGIGANAGVFSVINPLFISDLGVERPEELFRFTGASVQWSTPLFEEFRSQLQSADVAASGGSATSSPGITADSMLDGLSVTTVTGNYFQVLGIEAQVGRVFGENDDRIESPNPVFILSHRAWQRMLAGDRGAIGRSYDLSGNSFTLIGVTPSDVDGLGGDLWVPLSTQPIINPARNVLTDRRFSWMSVIGRPLPGITAPRVQAEATVIWNQLADEYGRGESSVVLLELGRGFARLRVRYGTALRIMMVAVGLLLLIACANVASLLLARSLARKREIAIRQALGCEASRLVRQFLVENSVLAALGGGLGLLVALAGTRAIVLVAAPAGFSDLNLELDQNVLLFTFGVSVVSAILFGIAPARQATRMAIEPELRSASRNTTPSRGRLTLNRAVVVIQTALSVALVAGAVLFGQSLYRIYSFDPGFDWRPMITASVNTRAMGYGEFIDDQYAVLAGQIVEQLSSLPGVTSASAMGTGFLAGSRTDLPMLIEDYGPEGVGVRLNVVSNNFLETLGVRTLSGRGFTNQDRPDGPRVAVVNDTFARTYFPGEDAIGKRVWLGLPVINESGEFGLEFNRDEPVEIVGTIEDSNYDNFRQETMALAFFPLGQVPFSFGNIQIRAEGNLSSLIPQVREAILEVNPRLDPTRIETLRQSLDRSIDGDILLSRLSGIFGGLGLILAGFGVYGLISYTVAQRTNEMGIRLTLGARPGALLRGVVLDALTTVLPGLLIGIAVAAVAAQYLESLLFGVSGQDPWTYLMVAASLLLTSILAAYVPARRASRIDPMDALRFE